MAAFAAVMTGKGTGALSTIQLFGAQAEAVIQKIFKPAGQKQANLQPGKILLGTIVDGGETIDHVTIGCEGPDTFAINCHGNPLIIEVIMELLQQHDVDLLTADEAFEGSGDPTRLLTAEQPMDAPGDAPRGTR